MGVYNEYILPHLLNLSMRQERHDPYRRRLGRYRLVSLG